MSAVTSEHEPRQASLRRLRDFGIRPNRELGQNFLVDSNLLGVIGRAAELSEKDVVLEIGGGLGVLSEYLAARIRHLHVVEVDRALEPPLLEALRPFSNATLHLADAVRLPLSGLSPGPTKIVANLPYGVAAAVLVRTVRELPAAELWVAMVQREVGDRLAAPAGSRTYGATSAIVGLSCEVRVLRAVGRAVFRPAPNVDSVLLLMRRVAQPPPAGTVALINAAFGHRRKALARSLSLDPGAAPGIRDDARAALARIGHSPEARAERLSPRDFAALAAELGDVRLAGLTRR